MLNRKTERNPKGGGRIPGKPCPNAVIYPGILAKYRLSYCRMRAQAKYRKDEFTLTWDEFQQLWDGNWHLKGRELGSLCMSRKDWDGVWSADNIELITRKEHFRRQGQAKREANAYRV